jgi:hypothetical protein
MRKGRTVFSQLMDFVSLQDFHTCVDRYKGHHKVKSFTCWDQFLCMCFAQLTHRESLRDIEASLRAFSGKLYHAGFRGKVSRNTLAHANRTRDWRIYRDVARHLIREARSMYANDPLAYELDTTVYALDSTTIDLCLSLFPWAPFQKGKAAVKLHTLLDLRGSIPTLCVITDGRVNDVNMLDILPIEPGAFYILDRGYLDFARLWRMHQQKAWFVTRARGNTITRRVLSRPVDKATGVRCDQLVLLSPYGRERYPEKLRRVSFRDVKQNKRLTFLTNHMTLPAITIAGLYHDRWQIELFFKWIKQHLRIKSFYGANKNAVKTQVWTAIATYVIVAIAKKKLSLQPSLYTLLQVFGMTLFEKDPIKQLFTNPDCRNLEPPNPNQLILFRDTLGQ